MKPFDRLRSLPPERQAGIALVAALLIILLAGAVYFLFLRAPYTPLFKDLRTADAATIVAELDKTKKPYRLADGGTTILVPEDRVDATRLEIMSADLPLKGAVGFEIFNESDMGLTEFAQRINYQRALQGELARTIMTLDAIDTARLHLTLGERALFREQRTPAKASVTVIPRAGMRVSQATVSGIQRLVAAAVPDLEVANVVVVDGSGRVISADTAVVDEPAPVGTPVEQYYEAKVDQALEAAYPGRERDIVVSAPGAPVDAVGDPANGAQRGFPLRVEVRFASGMPAEAEVRRIVVGAVGMNIGDVISIAAKMPPRAQSIADAPEARSDPIPATVSAEPRSALWWAVGAVMIACLVVIAMLRRKKRGQPMSPDERIAYAERLRNLLDKGSAGGARG